MPKTEKSAKIWRMVFFSSGLKILLCCGYKVMHFRRRNASRHGRGDEHPAAVAFSIPFNLLPDNTIGIQRLPVDGVGSAHHSNGADVGLAVLVDEGRVVGDVDGFALHIDVTLGIDVVGGVRPAEGDVVCYDASINLHLTAFNGDIARAIDASFRPCLSSVSENDVATSF